MTARVKGPGPWCGTRRGFTNHKCRCEPCKRAHAAYMRRARSRPGRTRDNMLANEAAEHAAAQWVRYSNPELWSSMFDAALRRIEDTQ